MSTAVENNGFKAYLGNEELLRKRQNSQLRKNKDRSKKVSAESPSSRYFTDGVRAPLLSDGNFNQSCRLDVVRSVKRQTTGSVSPENPGRKTVIPHIPLDKEYSNVSEIAGKSVGTMKFLLPNGSLRTSDVPKTSSRSVSSLDIKWKRSDSKLLDARDILYRNTYCNSHRKFRYHTSTLPSIAAQNKAVPRVNKNKSESKRKVVLKNNENGHNKSKNTIASETKIVETKCSEIRTPVEVGFLKVQKIKSHADHINTDVNEDLFLTVRQPTDLYRQNSNLYPMELRTERPMKYETVSPSSSRLNRKPSLIRDMGPFSVRDHRSVDAYKEYLETVKMRMELNSEGSARFENEVKNSPFGRETRVLQSVIDVNRPSNPTGTLSRDNKSLVIEIRPTWNEVSNGLSEEVESDNELQLSTTCPVNTPANEHDNL